MLVDYVRGELILGWYNENMRYDEDDDALVAAADTAYDNDDDYYYRYHYYKSSASTAGLTEDESRSRTR